MVGDASEGAMIDHGVLGSGAGRPKGGWAKFRDAGSDAMVADEAGKAYFDYGAEGLWTATVWDSVATRINSVDPQSMALVDNVLYVGFGSAGLWSVDYALRWRKLNDLGPRSITGSSSAIYLDYGSAGLWRWTGASGWKKLNDARSTALGVAISQPVVRATRADFLNY